ncbi:MAG: RNA methyltransferase [Lachnospiraceae bacterium]|nr:RNA methyltransferase [Lachnospiraceae bacterium]
MKVDIVRIRKMQQRASKRWEERIFIVEGIKMYRELPKEQIVQTVLSDTFHRNHPEIEGDVISDRDFEKISDTKTPQGILALARFYDHTEEELLSGKDGLFILLENLQDPGNAGTILRSAEAAGSAGVIFSSDSVDPYNSKVIRATMGSFFRVPFVVCDDLQAVIEKIRVHGGKTYAAHLAGAADYDTADYTALSAFVIGNESKGLTDACAAACDERIRIPMLGKVESLNAAQAATILLFEAASQRRRA